MTAQPERLAALRRSIAVLERAAAIGSPQEDSVAASPGEDWDSDRAGWGSPAEGEQAEAGEGWSVEADSGAERRGRDRSPRGAGECLPSSGGAALKAPSSREEMPPAWEGLRKLCGTASSLDVEALRLPLGAPLDGALGGGLACGALHEVFSADAGGPGAAMGFVAALASGVRGPVVWVRQDMAVHEAGRLYGAGCAELGADPDRLLLVEAPDAAGVLRAVEEALRHPAPALVIAEPWGAARVVDLTATRRLALRAAERGALALLLRPGAEPSPSVAVTRWLVGAARSRSGVPHGLGPPAFALELARNRLGPTGRWTMEWDADARRFKIPAPAPAPSGRVPAPPAHRPAAPPRAGGEGRILRWA